MHRLHGANEHNAPDAIQGCRELPPVAHKHAPKHASLRTNTTRVMDVGTNVARGNHHEKCCHDVVYLQLYKVFVIISFI